MIKINNHFYTKAEIGDFLKHLGYYIIKDNKGDLHAVKDKSISLNHLTNVVNVINQYKHIFSAKPNLKKLYIANSI